MKLSILHITPHLGGGVGRVLLNYLSHILLTGEENHAIACLEEANPQARNRAKDIALPLRDKMHADLPALFEQISTADLVIIHWWNHPLLYALLVNASLPPARVLIWSHVSGVFPTQNFTDELLAYPDLFVLATPYSEQAPAVRRLPPAKRQEKLRLVFSCAGIDHITPRTKSSSNEFRIGYIGTVDYCKMHPDFIRMSLSANLENAKFIICGGPNEVAISLDAGRTGFGEKFAFLGHIDNVDEMLASFDIFGYPLSPEHYGTGEQALIEALAAGVPPVVLANGAEQHIVENGITGLVTKTAEEYSEALETLYRDSNLRQKLSRDARQTAKDRFTIHRLARDWRRLHEEVMSLEKKSRHWPGRSPHKGEGLSGAELFITSLGEHACDFIASHQDASICAIEADRRISQKSGLFLAETRGSSFHYHTFFPEDPFLLLWCGILRKAEKKEEQASFFFSAASRLLGKERVCEYLKMADENCAASAKGGQAP